MLRHWSIGLLVVALAACGGGSDGGPTASDGVATVSLNAPSLTMLVGQSDQLTATAKDASGNAVAGAPAATWTSSNFSVATVTSSGVVTAVVPGTTNITATISGKSATAQVTVTSAATEVTVNMPGLSFTPFRATLKVGGTVKYVFPAQAHNVIYERVPGAPADIPGQVTNQTISRQFNTVRLFRYSCTLHPGMDGEVNVVP